MASNWCDRAFLEMALLINREASGTDLTCLLSFSCCLSCREKMTVNENGNVNGFDNQRRLDPLAANGFGEGKVELYDAYV